MKKLQFVSNAADKEFRALPESAQQDFAKSLQAVIEGEDPKLPFKALNKLGKNIKGVIELIINGSPAYRVVYVAKFNDTVYILHSFKKTTEGVDRPAMDTVVKRYKQIPK